MALLSRVLMLLSNFLLCSLLLWSILSRCDSWSFAEAMVCSLTPTVL